MKYKLGEKHPEKELYRVVALKDFGDVTAGDVGGWVEAEENLSQKDSAWVYGDAEVFGYAEVSGDSRIYGDSRVSKQEITPRESE